ncbi:MAG: serine/threonine protein kinase, partial [Lentisphaeraceae bacterium]|nr:serine/threonine protein kinase [Lentisphaeraceae bacterium]
VPMYEQGIHEGFPYYVMEKVDGRDLAWVLNQDRDYLPFSMVLKIAQQLAEVLDYIHSEDLIHRDIKLENIILDEYENIRLTDFGLSIDTSMSHPDYSKIVGTPLYLAPEIIIGRGEDLKVDIYAYGIVMFLLLTGRAPFEDTDVHSLMHHHCNTTPPRVDEIRSDIPMAWGDFIEACLLKNPKKRPNSLLEFTEDFRFLQYAVY